MSEPAATAKVILSTSKGQLVVELWAKEMPIACKAFLDACNTGKYNTTEFFRIGRTFAQAGPSEPAHFITEHNSRLRFEKRGTIACAADGDLSTTQILIARGNGRPESGVGTVIGRLVDDSVFVLEKIVSGAVDGDKPLYPVVIKSAEVVVPYFELAKPLSVAKTAKSRPKRQLKLYDSDSDEPVTKKRNPMLKSLDEIPPPPQSPSKESPPQSPSKESPPQSPSKESPPTERKDSPPTELKDSPAELKRSPRTKSEMLLELLKFEAQLESLKG